VPWKVNRNAILDPVISALKRHL